MTNKIDNRKRQSSYDAELVAMGIPRRRIIVDVLEIADSIINEMAERVMLYEEQTKGKSKAKKILSNAEKPQFDLTQLVEVIKEDVETAYKNDFKSIFDTEPGEEQEEEIESFKKKAITCFLERIRRDYREPEFNYLQSQVDKLAESYNIEHLKPKPEPSPETMKKVEELRQKAVAIVDGINVLKRQIAEAKDQLDQLWRLEVEQLRGTTQEGHSKIRTLIENT